MITILFNQFLNFFVAKITLFEPSATPRFPLAYMPGHIRIHAAYRFPEFRIVARLI